MHFCSEELMALMALVPGVPFGIMWAKSTWARFRAPTTSSADNG
jgi:hypothetical protein